MLKLFPLHQQQLVLWMQNNTNNQKENKMMPGRGRGIVVGGRGVVVGGRGIVVGGRGEE